MRRVYSIEINRLDHIQVNKLVLGNEPVGYFYRDDTTKGKFGKSAGLKSIELDKHPRELYTREQAIDVILKHNVTARKERNERLAKEGRELDAKKRIARIQ